MDKINIFDTFRATTHDGPGMRTTFFIQGCPLECRWCHNPEGITNFPQVIWENRKCIGCHSCIKACNKQALKLTEKGIVINRAICDNCGDCVAVCPAKAMHFTSKLWSIDEVVSYGLKDKAFYNSFGGGVTFSGGEAMSQYNFVAECSQRFKENDIHVALDTCGFASWENYLKVLPFIDCVLYDLKIMDSSEHKKFTNVDNKLIIENFHKLVQLKRETRKDLEIWIRTPLIPRATDTEVNIKAIGEIVKENADAIERWELCAFNNLGKTKYNKLNILWKYENEDLLMEKDVNILYEIAKDIVGDSVELIKSGLTRKK